MSGRIWTESLQKTYSEPGHKNYEQTEKYGAKWIGRRVTDCSGLLLCALKQLGESIVHQARYQYTDSSAPKGKLIDGKRDDGQPLLPGTAVFLQGAEARIHHVGVYVGHGICIEAKGTRWGVVTSKPDHWDHWGLLKMIDYTDAAKIEKEPAPEIPEEKSDTEVLYRAVVNNPGAWLNVRSGPGTSFQVLYRVERGDEVEVLAVSTDEKWWQIRFGGRIGWAWAEYLQLIEDNVDEPGDTEQEISAAPEAAPSEASGVSPADSTPAQPSAPPITQADLDALLVLIETAQLAMDKLDTRLESMKHSVEAMMSREAGE